MGKKRPPRRARFEPTPAPVPPTFETVLRRHSDPIRMLPALEQLAAAAIERGYRIRTPGLHSKASKLGPRTGAGRTEMSDSEATIASRYALWAQEVGRRHLPMHALLAVIVDGIDPEESDRRGNWPIGTTAGYLLEALSIYCRRFGQFLREVA